MPCSVAVFSLGIVVTWVTAREDISVTGMTTVALVVGGSNVDVIV